MARLKQEMNDLELGHRRDLEKSERRADEAESRANKARKEQEERVVSLEARLQELSETIGTYDRLRQHDQTEMTKMREKMAAQQSELLDVSKSSANSDSVEVSETLEELDIQVLVQKYYAVKKAMKAANAKAKKPVDLESILVDADLRSEWQREVDQVRSDFEAYKRQNSDRSNSPGSGSNLPPRSLLPEVDQEVILGLKTKISELQDKIALMRQQIIEGEKEKRKETDRAKILQKTLNETRTENQTKLDAMENEYRSKMLKLESELQKQRERCLTLIEEKEDEVNMLKSNMELAFDSAFSTSGGSKENSPDRDLKLAAAAATATAIGSGARRKSSRLESEDFTDGMKSANAASGDGMVLHYVQEISHKDVEISGLRKKVFDLESALREVQMQAMAKEERNCDEIDHLREEVAKLKRMSSGEGANMEYLKNVVLNYMLSSNPSSREHMLKAIGAVLIFSEVELAQIREYNASWWPQKQPAKKGYRTLFS